MRYNTGLQANKTEDNTFKYIFFLTFKCTTVKVLKAPVEEEYPVNGLLD
jgi:hypothetical protein